MTEHVDCAVIIVSYNSARYIARLLDSLPAAASGLRIRCIVVDNGSQDETLPIVRLRNDVMVVETGRNLGYSGAINVGRAHAGMSSSLLILNPDMVLEPGAIVRLSRALDEPGVGVAVPMLLTGKGDLYLSLRREPNLIGALGEALFGSHLAWRPSWLSDTVRDHLAYQNSQDVAWAGGAALLISAACNEAVGDWDDDRFFLYSEETDFAARARRHGFRIHYVPSARVCHEEGGSGRSPALGALLAVNRVRYYEKYHSEPAAWLFRAIVILHHLLRSAYPDHRVALKALVRRSRWPDLPGGRRVGRSSRCP
jgi:N-acetylglucosaminyl-diphospho-decaprenol L-rhamnosyltransferase